MRVALVFSVTLKLITPARSEERTRRPALASGARAAPASDVRRASDARLASRSTSRRPPRPAWETATEPRTAPPCWTRANLIAEEVLPASGEGEGPPDPPDYCAPGAVAVPVGVVPGGPTCVVSVVVPFALTVIVPLSSVGCT